MSQLEDAPHLEKAPHPVTAPWPTVSIHKIIVFHGRKSGFRNRYQLIFLSDFQSFNFN